MSLIRTIVVLTSLAFGVAAAFAQSPQTDKRTAAVSDTLEKWGLLGTGRSIVVGRLPATISHPLREWLSGKVMTERVYGERAATTAMRSLARPSMPTDDPGGRLQSLGARSAPSP